MTPLKPHAVFFTTRCTASSIPAAFDRKVHLAPRWSWSSTSSIYAVAVGKAALPMLETLRSRLPYALAGGICCAPVLPAKRIRGVEYYTGGHPLPNEDSFASARAALGLLQRATARDLVFFLISGGGSAMFELPLDERISLEETRRLYQALVGSGGTIAEINTVRKHFSAVKGGRLAAAVAHAAQFSLLLADVAPRYLDALSSGLTLPDTSTVAECLEIFIAIICGRASPRRCGLSLRILNCPRRRRCEGSSPIEILLSSDDLVDRRARWRRPAGL